jgi:hypothetical protein
MDVQWAIILGRRSIRRCRVCRELMHSQIRRERGTKVLGSRICCFLASDILSLLGKVEFVYRAWHCYLRNIHLPQESLLDFRNESQRRGELMGECPSPYSFGFLHVFVSSLPDVQGQRRSIVPQFRPEKCSEDPEQSYRRLGSRDSVLWLCLLCAALSVDRPMSDTETGAVPRYLGF